MSFWKRFRPRCSGRSSLKRYHCERGIWHKGQHLYTRIHVHKRGTDSYRIFW